MAHVEQSMQVSPADSAEAFMYHFIAHTVLDDSELKRKTGSSLEAVMNDGFDPNPCSYRDHEANLLIGGLVHVMLSSPESDWRHAQAKHMFKRIFFEEILCAG